MATVGATLLAVVAVAIGTELGRFHGPVLRARMIAWASAVVLAVAGAVAGRRLPIGLSHLLTPNTHSGSVAIVRFVMSTLGFLILVFAVFGVLGVSLGHLLNGAGVTGIVLGIAAQQSLGNVFASLVLLFARPLAVGDYIHIRSGTIGNLDMWVLGIGLTYVTVRTEDGVLRIPNSAMLVSGIGPLAKPPATSAPDPPINTARRRTTPRRRASPAGWLAGTQRRGGLRLAQRLGRLHPDGE